MPPDNETITLTEFVVSTSYDRGYQPGNSVSATRIDTPIKDLPFAVSAFTEEFIADIGARELKDIVRFAPSATNNSREFGLGNTNFAVRGFNSAPQRNGFQGTGYIDVATIQRVEVVKGPATLLYGQLQPGGVINYITKRPLAKPKAIVSAQYGSYDYYRGGIDVNQPVVPGKLLFRLNVIRENDFEYVDYHKGTTTVIAPVMTWNIDENTALTVDYQWFKRRENAQAMMKPNIQVPLTNRFLYGDANGRQRFPYTFFGPYVPVDDRFNTSDPNDFRHTDYDSVYVELQRRLPGGWSARGVFTYDWTLTKTRQHGRGDFDVIVPPDEVSGISTDPAVYMRTGLVEIPPRLAELPVLSNRRLQYGEGHNRNRTLQLEAVGKYQFGGMTWRPLVGYAYNRFDNLSFTNTLNTTLYWDFFNRATWSIPSLQTPMAAWTRVADGWLETNTPNSQIPVSAPNRLRGYNHGVYAVSPVTMLDDKLHALAGLRWSKGHTDSSATAPSFEITKTTPQFGIGYKLRPDLMLYASYSESFLANNRLLRFQSTTGTIPARPNEGKGGEIGLKADFWSGRLSATLAAFDMEEKNTIVTVTEILPNGQTVQSDLQVGNSQANRGLEFEMNFSPVNSVQVYFAASYSDPRFNSVGPGLEYLLDTQPESTAKRLASLWGRYSFTSGSLKGLWLAGGANYTGDKQMISNNPYLYWPDRTVFDLVVGYDAKWDKRDVTAALSWKNFTDEDDTPSVRTRGLPERVVFSVNTTF